MTNIVYTHRFATDDTSSVIDFVYYSEPEKLLFVALVNGVTAGYQDVPLNVYTALDTINNNRLNGDMDSSVGRYWNKWIKPNFTGYDTSDVNLLSQAEVANVDAIANGSGFWNNIDANISVLNVPTLTRFEIHFNEGEMLAVKAIDMDTALDRFRQVKEILGWGETNIVAVTQFFN